MRELTDSNADVLLREHETAAGRILAEAVLNVPKTLNSLSLPMALGLNRALRRWADDERVVALLFTGAGERAFCAGGDIQALYHAMWRNHEAGSLVDDYPFRFFEHEYRLDYRIHTFPKPVVTIGHGVVMGGGLGIFSASRFRVVTETSRIAYPEVTIGLFPDAGGTRMLRNLPPHQALFLGCTGAHFQAGDARAMGVATHAVASGERGRVRELLLSLDLAGDAGDNARISDTLDGLPTPALPPQQAHAIPEHLSLDGDYPAVVASIRALAGDGWLGRSVAAMERGCPTTVGVVIEQLRRAPDLSLADSFRMEWNIGANCARHTDFAEGVRALLIEKDNAPKWRFGGLDGLDWQHVLGHFECPLPENPLHDLEADPG